MSAPLIVRYASIAALADEGERRNCGADWSSLSCGGESVADTLRYARHGKVDIVPAAERLIERLSAVCEPAIAIWQPDVSGAYPIVAEFLAGRPDCMRRRVAAPDERAPINIHVSVSASGAISAEQIEERGAVILALVLLLSRQRPITLNVLEIGRQANGSDSVLSVPVNCHPLDIATAAYALTSAAFFRRLILGVHCAINPSARSFPVDFATNRDGCMRRICCELGGDPERDLIIAGAHVSDPLLTNPVAWVQQQLDRYGQGESV